MACGCVNTSKFNSDEERLVEIGRDISALIKKYKPDEAAIEDLFFFKNLKTAITVAQARGVILYEIKKNKIPLFSYTPLQVKQALTGYGRADKNQIQEMVKNILKLKCNSETRRRGRRGRHCDLPSKFTNETNTDTNVTKD